MRKPLSAEQVAHLRAVPAAAFPNRVGIAIDLLGIKQSDVAEGAGIDASTLSQIRNGRHATVQLPTAQRLAAFFGCAIEDLFPRRSEVA